MLKDTLLKEYNFYPEFMNSCGYVNTDKYKKELEIYRNTNYE